MVYVQAYRMFRRGRQIDRKRRPHSDLGGKSDDAVVAGEDRVRGSQPKANAFFFG